MGKLEKEEWSTCTNGVIVTIYEESSSRVSSLNQKARATNSGSNPTARSSCGYDRRAELLAYAHRLRSLSANAQQIHQDDSATTTATDIPPTPKKRRRLWGRLEALKLRFGRIFGQKKGWRYEAMESKGCECPSHRQGKDKWSNISKRLHILLKQVSSGCKCTKGFDQNL